MQPTGESRNHTFYVLAFVENFSLRELAAAFPEAKAGTHELRLPLGDGELFIYPFGALVFRDTPKERREAELARVQKGASPSDP